MRGRQRLLAGSLGVATILVAAPALRDPLASMADYTAALMALNQLAPPLLLAALPAGLPRTAWLDLLLDPWAATVVFIGLSVAISLPGVLDPAVADALYAQPLGLLELVSGLLFWAQLMPPTRSIKPNWLVGSLAWIAALPMTVVALVWMLAPNVLYTPFLDVICRWNIPPLTDQRWAGLVMFAAGLPLQLAGLWLLLGMGRNRIDEKPTLDRGLR